MVVRGKHLKSNLERPSPPERENVEQSYGSPFGQHWPLMVCNFDVWFWVVVSSRWRKEDTGFFWWSCYVVLTSPVRGPFSSDRTWFIPADFFSAPDRCSLSLVACVLFKGSFIKIVRFLSSLQLPFLPRGIEIFSCNFLSFLILLSVYQREKLYVEKDWCLSANPQYLAKFWAY